MIHETLYFRFFADLRLSAPDKESWTEKWELLGEQLWNTPDEVFEEFLKEAKHNGLKRHTSGPAE